MLTTLGQFAFNKRRRSWYSLCFHSISFLYVSVPNFVGVEIIHRFGCSVIELSAYSSVCAMRLKRFSVIIKRQLKIQSNHKNRRSRRGT